MTKRIFCGFLLTAFLLTITTLASSQDAPEHTGQTEQDERQELVQQDEEAGQVEPTQQIVRASRGSVPEDLLRPIRSDARFLPIDTVIGELGRGQASQEAFDFAVSVCQALLSGGAEDSRILSPLGGDLLERYLSVLEEIEPSSFRIGGGREEADGAVSFLIRFIGRSHGVTGELYIRHGTRASAGWVLEELLLEEAKDRVTENRESIYRYDFNPYERFF